MAASSRAFSTATRFSAISVSDGGGVPGGEPATVVLVEPTRYFAIGAGQLRKLVRRDAELASALHQSFTGEARTKLVAANDRQRRFGVGQPALDGSTEHV